MRRIFAFYFHVRKLKMKKIRKLKWRQISQQDNNLIIMRISSKIYIILQNQKKKSIKKIKIYNFYLCLKKKLKQKSKKGLKSFRLHNNKWSSS